MAGIPLPPSGKSEDEDTSEADCPQYDPIMGGYCKYFVTRSSECMRGIGPCDGFGNLKK